MKRIVSTVTTCALLMMATTCHALEGAVPGKSLWQVSLGSSRHSARDLANKRLALLGRYKFHTTATHGMVDDHWEISNGGTTITYDVVSIHGRVVQLRTWTSEEAGQTNLSFAQLIKGHHLRKSVYGFDAPGGGGWNTFYYDDVQKGIAFSLGVQDDFLLTFHPDAVIIHYAGKPIIPIEDDVFGKPVTGLDATAYANVEEARKAEQKRENDY